MYTKYLQRIRSYERNGLSITPAASSAKGASDSCNACMILLDKQQRSCDAIRLAGIQVNKHRRQADLLWCLIHQSGCALTGHLGCHIVA